MIFTCKDAVCVAVKPPKEWQNKEGRSGVTYKVVVGDGSNTIEMRCKDSSIWEKFKAFHKYDLDIDLNVGTNQYGTYTTAYIVQVGANG